MKQRLSRRIAWILANRWIVIATLLLLAIRLFWACKIPLGNDEVYYWDWARHPQLSYVDHPPGVAWLGLFSQSLGLNGPLAARFINPFIHLFASLVVGFTARFLVGVDFSRSQKWTWFVITQWLPALSLGSFFLLPDIGLLFALSLVGLQGVRVITRRRSLRVDDGLLLGLSYGLAGVFKYMAFPIAVGGVFAIFLSRRTLLKKELGFWITLLLVSVAMVLPVLSWNASHHWASFRFQAAHGFEGSTFGILSALRFWLGVTVLLSPWLLWQGILESLRFAEAPHTPMAGTGDGIRGERRPGCVFLVWSAVPLFLILLWQAWFKQLLPHWLVPSVWMILPLVIGSRVTPRHPFLHSAVIAYGAVFFILATGLSNTWVRKKLVQLSNDKPGALAELTFWEPLTEWLTEKLPPASVVAVPHSTVDCVGGKKVLAAVRWFWVSHLSFAFPGQPQVISLDMDHPSYYHQRNDLRDLEGCLLVVVADMRHVDREALGSLLDVKAEESVTIPGYGDIQVVLITGYLRAQRSEEKYQLVKGI